MNIIKFKDLDGNIQTVKFNPEALVEIYVGNESQEWILSTSDNTNPSEKLDFIGGRPKRD